MGLSILFYEFLRIFLLDDSYPFLDPMLATCSTLSKEGLVDESSNIVILKVENPDDVKSIPADICKGFEAKGEESTKEWTDTAEHKVSIPKANFSRISPSAKLLIAQHGLEPSSLWASGPRGTLLKGDVLAAIKSGVQSTGAHKSDQELVAASTSTLKPTVHQLSQSAVPLHDTDTHEDFLNSQIRKVRVVFV